MRTIWNAFNEEIFANLTPNSAWLLGILASDGCVGDDNGITINQSGIHGLKLIEYIAKLISFSGAVRKYKPRGGQVSHSIRFTSERTAQHLSVYNIVPRKSLIYEFPSSLPDAHFYHFLRGYIDGDGCVGTYDVGGSKSFLKISLVGTRKFVDEVQRRVAIPSVRRVCDARNCHEVCWNGQHAFALGERVYSEEVEFKSIKYSKWRDRRDKLINDNLVQQCLRKQDVDSLIQAGVPVPEISWILSEHFQSVYRWKAEGSYACNHSPKCTSLLYSSCSAQECR
jgi:hypothetical protein